METIVYGPRIFAGNILRSKWPGKPNIELARKRGDGLWIEEGEEEEREGGETRNTIFIGCCCGDFSALSVRYTCR